MKSRRLLIALLSMAMIFALSSCFDSSTDPEPDPDPTVAPVGVAASAGDAAVTVSWNAKPDALGYRIYWNMVGDVDATDAMVEDTASPYQHTGLTNGTTYYYRVSAVMAEGETPLSTQVSATPDGPCDVDALVDAAYTSLENTMFTYNQDAFEPDRPSDIDFSAPKLLYQAAYNCDATNNDARMGLALTNLLSVMMDEDVNAAFDTWDAYLDENTPFETDPSKAGGRSLGINLGLPTDGSSLELPYEVVVWTVLANTKAMLDGSEPQLSGVQDVLRSVLLPEVVAAIAMMEPVAADADFEFIVSGRMQGDVLEDDVEVDQTDCLAMMAMCRLMVAAITAATSYDIDFPSYDGDGIEAALNQDTGTFMTLHAGMSTDMSAVPGLFLAAFDDIEDAANALLAEEDDQVDDLIRRGYDDFYIEDINDLLNDALPKARGLFTAGGQTFSDDFDGDPMTPDQDLTLDLNAFFTTPITDMKAMIPPYTVSYEVRSCGVDWDYYEDELYGTTSFLIPDDIEGQRTLNYGVPIEDGEVFTVWGSDFEAFNTYCADAVDLQLAAWNADPHWYGFGMITFWTDMYDFTPGTTQTVDVYWFRESTTVDAYMYIPVLTFSATDFSTWVGQFPDPSMHGLMPAMETGQQVVEFFGIDGEDWEPTMKIFWFGCEDEEFPGGPEF